LREESRLRSFENGVLMRIFGLKMEGVTGEWVELHDEELNHLYSSPDIVRVINSRKMRWARHVTLWRREVVHVGFCWGNPREREHFEDPGIVVG
jgi:hypothetical protein